MQKRKEYGKLIVPHVKLQAYREHLVAGIISAKLSVKNSRL